MTKLLRPLIATLIFMAETAYADGAQAKSFGGDCFNYAWLAALECDLTDRGYGGLSAGQSKDEALAALRPLLVMQNRDYFMTFDSTRAQAYDPETGAQYNSGHGSVRCIDEEPCEGDLAANSWSINARHSRWRWSLTYSGRLRIEFDEAGQVARLSFNACYCP